MWFDVLMMVFWFLINMTDVSKHWEILSANSIFSKKFLPIKTYILND